MSELIASAPPAIPSALVGFSLPELLAHGNSLANADPEPSAGLAELLSDEQLLRTASTQFVTFQPALFWQDDEPVIWPRTVNIIQGQTGVHKSRVAELFGSALLAQLAGRPNLDATLGVGFRQAESERYRLIYIDTERNLTEQFPYALQQLKLRAGYGLAEHPPEFHYTSLVRTSRAERFPRLVEYLDHSRRQFKGHLIIILDVLSDCVADFNDVGASLSLIDLLNVAVNEQDATFLAVIHENPGTTAKARGHLGTEVSNKASTVLQVSLQKDQGQATGLIQLHYLKRRYAAPGLMSFATFDEATRGLVRADVDAVEKQGSARSAGAKRKISAATVLGLLPSLLIEPLRAGQLTAELVKILSIADRTVRAYLKELLQNGAGYVENNSGRVCRLKLCEAEKGPAKLYQLVPIEHAP